MEGPCRIWRRHYSSGRLRSQTEPCTQNTDRTYWRRRQSSPRCRSWDRQSAPAARRGSPPFRTWPGRSRWARWPWCFPGVAVAVNTTLSTTAIRLILENLIMTTMVLIFIYTKIQSVPYTNGAFTCFLYQQQKIKDNINWRFIYLKKC